MYRSLCLIGVLAWAATNTQKTAESIAAQSARLEAIGERLDSIESRLDQSPTRETVLVIVRDELADLDRRVRQLETRRVP